MKTKKLLREWLIAVVALIAAIIIVSMGFWLIDGRSLQASTMNN